MTRNPDEISALLLWHSEATKAIMSPHFSSCMTSANPQGAIPLHGPAKGLQQSSQKEPLVVTVQVVVQDHARLRGWGNGCMACKPFANHQCHQRGPKLLIEST